LTALGADKRIVHIRLKKRTGTSLKIRIRVGIFGDEMCLPNDFDKIKARL
jgi:hypothetical protein